MNLFLSTFINKIDKKGRVSVPAQFRVALRQEEFKGIIVYPSFVNECVEACGMDRISQISDGIDSLDPYSEERDAFATAILGESYQLSFDSDGRVVLNDSLMNAANLQDKALFIGKGKTFEIWNPEKFTDYAEKARKFAREQRDKLRFNKLRSGDE
jgi:MraZ protein